MSMILSLVTGARRSAFIDRVEELDELLLGVDHLLTCLFGDKLRFGVCRATASHVILLACVCELVQPTHELAMLVLGHLLNPYPHASTSHQGWPYFVW